MGNVDNLKGLDTSEAVIALSKLFVKRIVRSYEFETPLYYVWKTQILFQNPGSEECFIVPGEFYEEGVLIDFKSYDGRGTEGIRVFSSENNDLLIKYMFYKMISNLESSVPEEKHSDIKKVLRYQFTNNEEYLDQDDVSDEKILDQKFEGHVADYIRESMGKRTGKIEETGKKKKTGKTGETEEKEETENMAHYLDKKLTEGVPVKYVAIRKNLGDYRIRNICSQQMQDFICHFDGHFLQLILLRNPIPREGYSTLTLEANRLRPSKKDHFRLSEEINLLIDICPLLPGQDISTLHYMIKPPEGIKFITDFYWRHELRFRKDALLLEGKRKGEEKRLNPKYFDIFHDCSSQRCIRLLSLLKINVKQGKKPSEESAEKSAEKPSINVPAKIDYNLMALYFSNSDKKLKTPCNENQGIQSHKIKIRLGIDKIGISTFHYLLMIFLVLLSALSSYWLYEMYMHPEQYSLYQLFEYLRVFGKPKPTLEIPSSFWSFAFFVIVQSISTIFDYSRRNDAQRYFMRGNIYLILFFIVLAISLLALIVLLPIIIH